MSIRIDTQRITHDCNPTRQELARDSRYLLDFGSGQAFLYVDYHKIVAVLRIDCVHLFM